MIDSSKENSLELDANDPLKDFRNQFYIPKQKNGEDHIYLCGNSLGLQPKNCRDYINQELDDWATFGVEGHFHAKHPWMPYHEFLTNTMAEVVGAKPSEVVVMNSLTVNLHLMMVSFYRPTPTRNKILIEYNPFPSDRYATRSQIKNHGYDPDECLIELKPDQGENVSLENIKEVLDKHGDEIALVLIGGVNYYTGQAYRNKEITSYAHSKGCKVGFDYAHGAGNIKLNLHDSGMDFAVWCSYKYLNSGPGSLSGCFVHERHHEDEEINRFTGWWGHDKQRRFLMEPNFVPIKSAEAWQLSNPPIFPMAAIRASLDLFKEAGMDALTAKSKKLTGYLESLLLQNENNKFSIITPSNPEERGCQLSIQVKDSDKRLYDEITAKGVIADWREPDVIRIAPVPMYNSFEDAWKFVELMNGAVG